MAATATLMSRFFGKVRGGIFRFCYRNDSFLDLAAASNKVESSTPLVDFATFFYRRKLMHPARFDIRHQSFMASKPADWPNKANFWPN